MPRSKIVSRLSHIILLGIWLCSAATACSAEVRSGRDSTDARRVLAIGESGGRLSGAGRRDGESAFGGTHGHSNWAEPIESGRGRSGEPARVAVCASDSSDCAGRDDSVYERRWRDAQCSRGFARIPVQSIDVPWPVPRLHADPAGRDETGLRHSPAHERICDRQPDAVGDGLRSGGAVPAR